MNRSHSLIGDRLIMTPEDPGFHEILGSSHPPDPEKGKNFIFRSGSMVAEAVEESELEEYLEGGEYDERMDEIESDILFLPL